MTDIAQQFEVEVKVLLGDDSAAEAFLEKLQAADPSLAVIGQSSQLNHYFDQGGDTERLLKSVKDTLSLADFNSFASILNQSAKYALRTRQDNAGVKLVIKAATGGGDEQHAIERLEGDYLTDRTEIAELDELIRGAGYAFLSKWSRDRTEYQYKHYTVTLDKNAGYGYLAEIERVVGDETAAAEAKQTILAELGTLGVEELSQERVGRMFAYYNQHWPEYYQTNKTFTVE